MGFLRCCVYYAALGVASFFVGRLLPKSWFHADRFPYRCAPWEAKLYRALRVHAWQDKVPDMSRIVPKLIPAKKLEGDFRAQLPRMIEETCVAELIHFLLMPLGLYALRLWPGAGGALFGAAKGRALLLCAHLSLPTLGTVPTSILNQRRIPNLWQKN